MRARKSQRGFSLIELMISITLGLILMAGVLSIFFSSKVTYLANEKTARLQENGRVALDFITHDVRSAGYNGCARGVRFTSTLNNPNSLLWNFEVPLQGFESDGGGGYAPALPGGTLNPLPNPESDILVVRGLDRDGRAARLSSALSSGTANAVTTGAVFTANTLAMISDCNQVSVFQIRTGTAGVVTHAAGGANPGNATNNLGYAFELGARIAPLQTYIYYVANDPLNNNEPSLYRQSGATAAQVLIDGVQAMQVAYGEDTNNDRFVDRYVPANAVGNWDRVISVSVSFLMRSEVSGTNVDNNTYQILPLAVGGQTLGPYADLRQRMTFTSTIAIRNRAE